MYIKDIYLQKKPVISVEVFPPKPDSPLETVFTTVQGIWDLKPDYISVTYGAAGSGRKRTGEIASRIKRDFKIETMAHLTCMGQSPSELDAVITSLQSQGITNILALRGDPPKQDETGAPAVGGYRYAAELIEHLRGYNCFSIGAAAYPEGHINCRSWEEDWRYLRDKVAMGVDFLITQLFFDNRIFYNFRENLARLGVKVPVSAGIMPVLNAGQIKRMLYLSGASLPAKLLQNFDKYGDDPEGFEQAGMEYAICQIKDLIANGVAGIHLYSMNRVKQTRRILESIL